VPFAFDAVGITNEKFKNWRKPNRFASTFTFYQEAKSAAYLEGMYGVGRQRRIENYH